MESTHTQKKEWPETQTAYFVIKKLEAVSGEKDAYINLDLEAGDDIFVRKEDKKYYFIVIPQECDFILKFKIEEEELKPYGKEWTKKYIDENEGENLISISQDENFLKFSITSL